MGGASKDLTFILLGDDKTASKTMSATAEAGEKAASRVGSAFSGMGAQVGGEFGSIAMQVGEGFASLSESTSKASTGLIVGGSAITGVGLALTTLGANEKQAQDQLSQAISDTGNSFSDYQEDIEATITKQEGFGHSSEDTQAALQKMTQATGDPTKALDQMGVAADLAAARHISLSDAADLVDRVVSGSGGKTLAQYGITMDATKDKTDAGAEALQQLGDKLDGQASTSVDNFGAQVGVVGTKLGDWAAQVGQNVGPAMTILGPVITGVGVAMDFMRARQEAATVATLAQTAVQEGSTVATEAATGVQWLLNTALLANPIGLVVVLLAGLVAGVIWAYNNIGWFKDGVNAAFSFIGTVATWLWESVIQPVFGFIGATAVWLYSNVIQPYFQAIGTEIQILGAVFNWLWGNVISPVFNWISTGVQLVGQGIGIVFGGIGSMIRGAFDGVVSFVRGIFNTIIDVVDGIIGKINGVTALGGAIGINIGAIPLIPHLAGGGVSSGPTMALIGDNPGGQEVVQPLAQYRADMASNTLAATKMLIDSMIAQHKDSGGKGLTIENAVFPNGMSAAEISNELAWMGSWAT